MTLFNSICYPLYTLFFPNPKLNKSNQKINVIFKNKTPKGCLMHTCTQIPAILMLDRASPFFAATGLLF